MRVLMVTSFPIPGEYDGTAMLPIKILRALKPRGVDVVMAYCGSGPRRACGPGPRISKGRPCSMFPRPAGSAGRACGKSPASTRSTWSTPSITAGRRGPTSPAGGTAGRWSTRSTRSWATRSSATVWAAGWFSGRTWRRAQGLPARGGVIVLGEPVKQVVVTEKGVPAERVSVIYPGIDLAEYERPGQPATIPGVPRAQGHHVRRQHRPPQPGRADPDRGAAAGLRARPEARCVLVGGPAEAGERYRAQLGPHGDRLIVLTGQTPEQVVALSRRADVLVHPRLACRENYSVQSKIAVYLAAGRPIVATDFGDYQHLLGRTGAGLLTAVAAGPLAEGIIEGPDRPRPGGSPRGRDRPRRARAFRHGPQHRPLPRRLPACHRPGSKINVSRSPWMESVQVWIGQP